MKQEDMHYESWLAELRKREPILDNPEALTVAILEQISQTPPVKKRKPLLIGVWTSGIAALFVLGLLVHETCFPAVIPPVIQPPLHNYCQNRRQASLPGEWEEMTPGEKNSYLLSYYAQYREMRQARFMEYTKKASK